MRHFQHTRTKFPILFMCSKSLSCNGLFDNGDSCGHNIPHEINPLCNWGFCGAHVEYVNVKCVPVIVGE